MSRWPAGRAVEALAPPTRWAALAVALVVACVPLEPSLGASTAPDPGATVAAAVNPPVAVDARLVDEGGAAKLTFDLSAPVEARAFSMADPDRIVVDVPEVNFQIDPAVGRAPQGRALGPIVKSFRFGLLGPGRSRIVIDLAGPARVTRLATQAIANGAAPARLQIELSRCEPAAFQQAARDGEQAAAPTQDTQARGETSPTAPGPLAIVLDPGHGGVDSGAIGPGGAVEKTIVYEFTTELAQKLEASGRYRVVLTRHGDEFVSLADRVKIARDENAALLISIHADTLQAAADVSGATVYTVADRASDAEAARIAERENAADKAAGVEQKQEAVGVADILFDLKRRETRAYAHIFSRGIVEEWRGAARLNHNPERSAGFVVLKAPDFPSVLLELGYLSSPQDVKSMTSPEWRAKATTALASAIDRFFVPHSDAGRAAPKAEASANPPDVEGAH
ncbi:N-acetylmuramoyl-L-alanine amidase [Methylocapsa sp. S129]|uniref:N-acetylmuramoyl-L-alanine amidase n=1 Tax=Methylocapsa sp. S129 TaxID=1641869 RepID=UPI00131B30A9|nr:N-acetylmuramoyl-L-alanine amidase [Methylocapsa sp. S129]